MDKKTAKRAAKWWSDHLRHGAPMDNGDTSPNGPMTMMLGTLVQDRMRSQITPEAIDRFEQELAEIIVEEAGEYTFMHIGVDYHPDGVLAQAANRARIDVDFALPWKTSMWIEKDRITVSLGYRGLVTELIAE